MKLNCLNLTNIKNYNYKIIDYLLGNNNNFFILLNLNLKNSLLLLGVIYFIPIISY